MLDILAHASNHGSFGTTLTFAADLSVALDASLTGLYSAQIVVPMLVMDAPVFMNDITEELLARRDKACAADTAFRDWAGARGVRKCSWQVVEGVLDETLAIAGNWHDFIVLGSGAASPWGSSTALGDLLVTLGHACVIVPEGHTRSARVQCIAVAWNGSREAMRAVHAALPLLQRAGRIVLLKSSRSDPHEGLSWHPPFDIERYLAMHDLKVTVESVEIEDQEVGPFLLERAAAIDADVLVMGAYGRLRLSERVLGGATRHVLEHARIPLFMRH